MARCVSTIAQLSVCVPARQCGGVLGFTGVRLDYGTGAHGGRWADGLHLDMVRSCTSQVACDVQSQWWRVVHAALFPVLRARGTMRADQTFEAKWSGNNAVPVDRADERQRDHRGSY